MCTYLPIHEHTHTHTQLYLIIESYVIFAPGPWVSEEFLSSYNPIEVLRERENIAVRLVWAEWWKDKGKSLN